MTVDLCNTCTQAALLPAGIHACLSGSFVVKGQCSVHILGTPKLLTHADLIALNSIAAKLKVKEHKEPIKAVTKPEVKVEKPVEKAIERPVPKKAKLNSQASLF
jgi:hypothetical protein